MFPKNVCSVFEIDSLYCQFHIWRTSQQGPPKIEFLYWSSQGCQEVANNTWRIYFFFSISSKNVPFPCPRVSKMSGNMNEHVRILLILYCSFGRIMFFADHSFSISPNGSVGWYVVIWLWPTGVERNATATSPLVCLIDPSKIWQTIITMHII